MKEYETPEMENERLRKENEELKGDNKLLRETLILALKDLLNQGDKE